ncbi:uncharacterized protein LOC127839258 [Dreissena polymorpha]|nr:uncharacterized protein LOC127839258 [Dreissena polymorpha]
MKLVICLIIAAVCVSVIDAQFILSHETRVSQQQFTSQIATGQWLILYSVFIGSPGAFSKAKYSWRVSGNSVTRTTVVSQTTCQTVIANYTLGEHLDPSGAALLREVFPGHKTELFYSQDPSKYIWMLLCRTPGPTPGSCTFGFFDLAIKDTRTNLTGDLNLVGLPWDMIAADLRATRGLTFDNPVVQYVWTGTECPNP